jgi:hypothetical protein
MNRLSAESTSILERMEPDRRYQPDELRAFVPDASAEDFRAIMHELWVERQVERVGYAGWRRHRSAPPQQSRPPSGDVQIVKPEDLFDHATFEDFFK